MATGAESVPDTVRPTDVLTLLDRVEDRDRPILAMLVEHTHPDDIAATVGISAAALKRRRARIADRLRASTVPRGVFVAQRSVPTDELGVRVRSTSP
jgi:FixJ family two-component response regulator